MVTLGACTTYNFFFNRTGFSLSEALDILYNDIDADEIFIEPPELSIYSFMSFVSLPLH